MTLIQRVAARTRLLALNATIEAARAGEAGRGFAVVAHEVKMLADETSGAVEQIGDEIASVRDTANRAAEVLGAIAGQVGEMHEQALGVAAAVDGGGVDAGLARLAESLQADATEFLAQLRDA
mgnify:FL=1